MQKFGALRVQDSNPGKGIHFLKKYGSVQLHKLINWFTLDAGWHENKQPQKIELIMKRGFGVKYLKEKKT